MLLSVDTVVFPDDVLLSDAEAFPLLEVFPLSDEPPLLELFPSSVFVSSLLGNFGSVFVTT